jgi:hypothetical protein
MSGPNQIDPLELPGCFAYLETDIAPGLTLAAWPTQPTGDPDQRPRGPRAAGSHPAVAQRAWPRSQET